MNEHHQPFEEIKQVDDEGSEYWSARELAKLLDYSEYRHFTPVLERAKEACLNSGTMLTTISRMSSVWSKLVQVRKGS